MRPLAYAGKLLMPHAAALTDPETGKQNPWIWRESLLSRSRRTEEAKQLPSRSMIQMEAISPTALPSTDTSNVGGAHKYAQIGADAANKLLKAAVEA